jgi:hypothetical protein
VDLREISFDEDRIKKYNWGRFTVPWFEPVPWHAGIGNSAG